MEILPGKVSPSASAMAKEGQVFYVVGWVFFTFQKNERYAEQQIFCLRSAGTAATDIITLFYFS